MGIVDPYFPKEISLELAAVANAQVFVETGTCLGRTTKWASTYFKKIHTIELSEYLYNKTKDKLISKGNIIPYLGDSKVVLPEILKAVNTNAVFWLDGHYSGGVTAGVEDPCPLLKELEIILSRDNDDIIIIDDARLYTGGGWPSIIEIFRKIEEISKNKKYLQICDDHIYIIPQNNKYKEIILDYILKRSILLWNLHRKSIKDKMHDLCINILKKTGTYNIVVKIYAKVMKK
jgi:hypothetical protein